MDPNKPLFVDKEGRAINLPGEVQRKDLRINGGHRINSEGPLYVQELQDRDNV
jgi:hypothetical protein